MTSLAPVIDLTLVKLNKKRREAGMNGSVVEEHALGILIDGYHEGLCILGQGRAYLCCARTGP